MPTLARLGLALLPLALCACDAEPQPRSVVWIVVDTARADHFGAYGYARATTPNLDARISSGRLFENAWATSSWTLPSFGSLYTGELPARHQAGSRIHGSPNKHRKLSEQTPTLAEILGAHGYQTAAIVSNPFLHPSSGTARGFQDYDFVPANNNRFRRADVAVDRALAWLAERGDAPFFLVLHLFDPHMNYDPAPSSRGVFTEGIDSQFSLPIRNLKALRTTKTQFGTDDLAFLNAAYDEELAAVDHELERLLAWLHDTERGKECLVALTSDHGEEIFDHGGFEHGHAMWEEVLHVPLVLWGPEVCVGRSAAPVSIADLMPTMLDAVGIAPPEDIYGESLWGHVTRDEPLPTRPIVAQGTLYGPARRAIRSGDWKLVLRASDEKHLYDLSGDPSEREDRGPQQQARLQQLDGELARILEHARPGVSAPEAELDPSTEADLRSLGYTK